MARLAREDLLGPVRSRIHETKVVFILLQKLVGVVIIIKPVQNWHLE